VYCDKSLVKTVKQNTKPINVKFRHNVRTTKCILIKISQSILMKCGTLTQILTSKRDISSKFNILKTQNGTWLPY